VDFYKFFKIIKIRKYSLTWCKSTERGLDIFKTATSVEDFCRRLHRIHSGVECEQWTVTDSESEDDNKDMT